MSHEEKIKSDFDDQKVDILVNEKSVVLEGQKQTGSSIKKVAIEQGVNIQLTFVLSIERGDGKTDLIGDDESIFVNSHDRFLAIENDDNS